MMVLKFTWKMRQSNTAQLKTKRHTVTWCALYQVLLKRSACGMNRHYFGTSTAISVLLVFTTNVFKPDPV